MLNATALRVLTEADLRQYEEDGFLIRRALFPADRIAALRDTFMAQAANGPVPGLSDTSRLLGAHDPLSRYPRMMHPHRHPDKPVGPLALRGLLDDRIRDVLWDLFAEEPLAAQSMFYFKPPGARGQDLHQDNFYLKVKPGTCMAAWVAVDRADRENGGMVVVPGSHKLDLVCPQQADRSRFFTTEHVPVPDGLQEVPADLEPGDVLFFNGSVIHGSYPNGSRDRFRRAFICHYLPRSSAEISKGYRPILDFNGRVVDIAGATGGGPCGTLQSDAMGPH